MPLVNYLSMLVPAESWFLIVATIAGVLIVFVLAEIVARVTIVYRRNNLGVLFAFVLAAGAFYAFGYIGLLAFVAGTVTGAWIWVYGVESANVRVHNAPIQETGKSPEPRFGRQYRHADNHHAVNGT